MTLSVHNDFCRFRPDKKHADGLVSASNLQWCDVHGGWVPFGRELGRSFLKYSSAISQAVAIQRSLDGNESAKARNPGPPSLAVSPMNLGQAKR
jgi:hypothetical protein